jgi:hypothetical protein
MDDVVVVEVLNAAYQLQHDALHLHWISTCQQGD